jgi:hypothetical protein
LSIQKKVTEAPLLQTYADSASHKGGGTSMTQSMVSKKPKRHRNAKGRIRYKDCMSDRGFKVGSCCSNRVIPCGLSFSCMPPRQRTTLPGSHLFKGKEVNISERQRKRWQGWRVMGGYEPMTHFPLEHRTPYFETPSNAVQSTPPVFAHPPQ